MIWLHIHHWQFIDITMVWHEVKRIDGQNVDYSPTSQRLLDTANFICHCGEQKKIIIDRNVKGKDAIYEVLV